MAGGYTDALSIPVEDTATTAIAGALFEPEGPGPFAIVIYMSGSDGIDNDYDRVLQKRLIRHFRARNIATLILDPFTPRGETGVTGKLVGTMAQSYYERGARDFLAAAAEMAARPEIDSHGVFLQGYSYGAGAALAATDRNKHDDASAKPAGVIAFYPPCCGGLNPGVPTLILTGAQDRIFPAPCCTVYRHDPNLQVFVYPGATHNFAMPGMLEGDYFGEHQSFDSQAVEDAQRRVDAFIADRLHAGTD